MRGEPREGGFGPPLRVDRIGGESYRISVSGYILRALPCDELRRSEFSSWRR